MKLRIAKTDKYKHNYEWIKKRPGKNSAGEEAPWCIISDKTGKILSRHTTWEKAVDAFIAMETHIHSSSTPGEEMKLSLVAKVAARVVTRMFDHREILKGEAWVDRQIKAGKKVFCEDNGSDTYSLLAGESREVVEEYYKKMMKKQGHE
jgi:hypothetical protein